MTRRLVAAALIAGSVGFVAAPALAQHHDNSVCIGGDGRDGRMIGYCVNDPRSVVEIGTIPLPILPPPPPGS
jgi:hypothetical protein